MARDLPRLKLRSSAERSEVEGEEVEVSNEVNHLGLLLFNKAYSRIL